MIPKLLKRTTIEAPGGGAQAAAVGADADESASGSDSDAHEYHEFTADGILPEALTALHMVKSDSERAAQLAQYCHDVYSSLGMPDIKSRYPKHVHLLHNVDGAGERNNTAAFMLVPTYESPGVNTGSLGESVMFRSGSYTDVPVPS